MTAPSFRASFLAALLALGCGGGLPVAPACGDGACGSEETVTWEMTGASRNVDLDVLFIVDDTSAIAGSEDSLAAAYPQIAQLFERFLGGLPSLHLGIAAASVGSAPSCDVAAGGPPRARASVCAVTGGGPNQFLTTNSCGYDPSFTGSLADALSCLGDLGTTGCAPAQPLTVAREILTASSVAGSGWTGFLRPNAYLLLIFVAAQDDASGPSDDLTDVTAFASYVRGLKGDPTYQILVSAIAPSASCASGSTTAAPRLSAFVSAFGWNGIVGCTVGDLVSDLGSLLFGNGGETGAPRCLTGIRDTDPATPGLQADCVVEDRVTRTDGFWSEGLLESCAVSTPPCWTFTPGTGGSAGACPGRLLFTVERGSDFCPQDSNISTVVTCLGCVDPADPACQLPP
jgi:hypothetical protein